MPIINGRGRVGIRRSVVASSYLLDTYSGSAVAYSLRKLSSSYSGSAIRVRRSQDNTEQNIGFDISGNLDTAALTSFVGAGNGFVTTWYDQSGNGKNVAQTTASLQPQIVASGTIYTKNGKPSIFWTNASTNKIMTSSSSVSLTEITVASVIFPIKIGNYDKFFSIGQDLSNSNITYSPFAGSNFNDWAQNDFLFFGSGYASGQSPRIISIGQLHPINIMTHTFLTMGASNTKVFFNNNGITSYRTQLNGTINVGDGIVRLGNGSTPTQQFGGHMQELILFSTNKISDRSGISSNQNTYYSIYNTVFPEWSLNNVDGEQFLSALRNDVKSFNTGSIGTISNALFNGSYICSILGTDGKIYYIPYSANNILVFDPATNAVTTISVISGSAKWCGAALAPNGKIYAVPLNAAKVLILDIATSAVSYINSVGTGNYDWYGAVLAPNGKIYGLPYNNQNVLVVNTDTNTTSTINTGIAGSSKWGGGVLAGNGKIYCISNTNTSILVIDTNANTTSTFGSFTSGGNKWANLVLAPNGKIYGIPFSSRHIIVIDPSNNSSVLVDTLITSTYKWSEGVLAPNGKIYAMPSTLTDSLLEIDPDTNSFNNITISGLGSGYANPKLAANGKIYFRNGSGTKVVSIGDSQTMNINRVLSRYVNLY